MLKCDYKARFAESDDDIEAAQRLRYQAFIGGDDASITVDAKDADDFDVTHRHVLIEHEPTGALVATFRLLLLKSGEDISNSYSAQYYDLDALQTFDKPMVELGRFCVAPGLQDPDILRVAWGAVAAYVDQEGIELLFGCSSFHGTDTEHEVLQPEG